MNLNSLLPLTFLLVVVTDVDAGVGGVVVRVPKYVSKKSL